MKKSKRKQHSLAHHKSLFQSIGYVVISFMVALVLYQLGIFHQVITSLDGYGYIGAFFAGMFFVSVFTAAPAGVVLLALAETHPLVPLAFISGVGAVVGDLLIMSVLNQSVNGSVGFFPKEMGIKRVVSLLRHTKYRFFLTVIGAFVVASPLPDELGLALMGVSKIKFLPTVFLTFVLNTLGIFLLLSIFR